MIPHGNHRFNCIGNIEKGANECLRYSKVGKKAIQLEEKGLIRGEIVKEGKMPEKVIYSLTDAGEAEFERLMFEISGKPINIFLDFNAVIVNLDSLPPEKQNRV